MREKRGFALIYVVLLVALISVTVVALGASSLTNIKIARKADDTAKVRQVAQSGLELSAVEWTASNKDCSTITQLFMDPTDHSQGEADIVICSNYVESVGTYNQSKMKFKAMIETNTASPDYGNILQVSQIGT